MIPDLPTTHSSNESLRQMTIQRLRCALIPIAGNRSMCRVAADCGIFCRGFRRWQDREFDRRWRRAIGRSTHLNREQMERCADFWQLTEQLCQGVALACDEKPGPNSPCRGWDEFSDEDLARFSRELVWAPEPIAIMAGDSAGQRGD